MRTWHFYVALLGLSLLAFGGFTIVLGGRPSGPGVLLAASVFLIGLVARLVYRAAAALLPGAVRDEEERRAAVGRRRKELEREYQTLKRALKELELDHAMGKLSERDYTEIRTRYRERAVRILRQLDQGQDYRRLIEADLAARRAALSPGGSPADAAAPVADAAPAAADVKAGCPACGARNDADADFCKRCGARLTDARPAALPA